MGRWTKQRQFKPDGTFYAPNEPREKMKKCTEWTEEQAIPALRLWRPVTERVRLEDLGAISLGKLCVSVALCQCGSVAVWQVLPSKGKSPRLVFGNGPSRLKDKL
jgi:hypothetical protein